MVRFMDVNDGLVVCDVKNLMDVGVSWFDVFYCFMCFYIIYGLVLGVIFVFLFVV